MAALRRIRKVINWLIYQDVAENERDLSEKMGYTKSSFSQIINSKVPLSDKFIKNLCLLDENINEVWIKEGVGEMLKNNVNSEIVIPSSAWNVIECQAESLAARDRQIDELIDMLKTQMTEFKKVAARLDGNAAYATVV